jgi:hypothetical protein
MMSDYQGRIDSAIEELRAWAKDNPGDDPEYDGILHEFADGCVPVYTSDILEAAMDNFALATCEPESGLGGSTAIDMITANIYEDAYQQLVEAWAEIEQEIEEDEQDEDEQEEIDPDQTYTVGIYPYLTRKFRDIEPMMKWNAICYDSDLMDAALGSAVDVWNVFSMVCAVAHELGIRSLEIEWKITENQLREINNWRESQKIEKLIEQQNSRSTKVVKDE